ncbi:phasin family protein [Litorimonas sp. RW-G-Af-16]|uniref:phasin family protein n=1 Tax=Litorimonas sp. RW-G-Af-16 TaxID=3241168 RepID=UPI00390C945C
MTDKKKRKNSDTARRIWLAGIGAYGRAFSEAQGAIKEVTGKSSDVFDDLVQKGEMIEMVGKAKGKQMLDKAHMPEIDLPELDMSDRIKAMRARLSRVTDIGAHTETDDIEARLSAVEAKLDKVLALLEKPAKKPSAKRVKTQRTPKAAAKKSPPKA